MFQVEPVASWLAPLASRLRYTAGLLLTAAAHRGETNTLPSYLGTMLGSAPRLRRRRAELVALDEQAKNSGVTWGGEGGGWLTHLFVEST